MPFRGVRREKPNRGVAECHNLNQTFSLRFTLVTAPWKRLLKLSVKEPEKPEPKSDFAVPDLVSSNVMAKVPGWEERSKRMLAEYGAPTHANVEWADGVIFGTPTRFGNTSA